MKQESPLQKRRRERAISSDVQKVKKEKKDYEYSYKHPGRTKEGTTKEKYEDVDKYYKCPKCGGTIDNYSWHCYTCRYTATVYNENPKNYKDIVNKEETQKIRKNLKRINPWTGGSYK